MKLVRFYLRFPIHFRKFGIGFATDVYLLWPWYWKRMGWRPWYDINFNAAFHTLRELDQLWTDYANSTASDNPFPSDPPEDWT